MALSRSSLTGPWRAPHAGIAYEYKRQAMRSTELGVGTLACTRCDAPVAPGDRALLPSDRLTCPYCRHRGAVRDFLSLASPARPARVVVRVAYSLVRPS